MSMTVAQQSPAVSWSFDEDAERGVLKSMTGLGGSTYGAYAPGLVELRSSSQTTKKGVVRANISIRVPIAPTGPDAVAKNAGNDFFQLSLTATCPNKAGIVGSTDNTSGIPNTAIAANLAAVNEALSILLNLVGNQGAGVLAAGKSLVSPANSVGLFDENHPIARGLAGAIPVDPSQNRAILNA